MNQTPAEVKLIPSHFLMKGPDAIRGSGVAFILTKYPDPDGERWFVQPGSVGHETMTNSPEMLEALFGPQAQEVAQEVVTVRDKYVKDAKGQYVPSGEKQTDYDYHEVRRLAKRENLFGRYGKLAEHPVVMLWGAPVNWQDMLADALHHLKVAPGSNTVVTVGSSNQFMAKDFLAQGDDAKQAQASRVDAGLMSSRQHLELLSQYHTAQGARKAALAKALGLNQETPRPGSPADWRRAAREKNIPNVYDYGEVRYPGGVLSFKGFLGDLLC